MLEILTEVVKLAMRYGPDAIDGAKKVVGSIMQAPETTEEEKAHLADLMTRMDAADARVADTPLPGQHTE